MNVRFILFFGLVTFFSITALHAQDEKVDSKDPDIILDRNSSVPKATIKINIPVLLLDPKRAFYLATDIRISKVLSLEMGGGPYLSSWAFSQYKEESFSGLRARLGLKYYYRLRKNTAPYVGVEGLFNRYKAKQYFDVRRYGTLYNDVSRYEGLYIDKTMLTTETITTGVAIRTRIQIFMGPKKQFFFDFYGGVGIKFADKERNLSDAADVDQVNRDKQFWFLDMLGIDYDREPGHYVNPYLTLGVYFGYSFR